MPDQPLLTVVVIVYNDAARLPHAVSSVLGQTLRSLEIVIVDDASTDASGAVADRLAARHGDRVRALHLEANSGGCSRPRNTGVDAARGQFVMFLDSDDELPRDACQVLVEAANEAKADFAAGRCVRVHVNDGMRTTPWYQWLYTQRVVYSSVLDNPDLLYDTLSTNKCYRKEFLDRYQLRFPDGYHYEDLLFSAEAYLNAQRIVLVPDLVYRWYTVDETDTPSITNRRSELRNFADRIRIQQMIDQRFADRGAVELNLHKDIKFLRHDLRLYIGDLPWREESYRRDFFALAKGYLETLDPRAFHRAPPMDAIIAWLIVRGDEAHALAAIDFVAHGGKLSTRLVERGGRIYWCADHLDTADGQAILDVTELNLHTRSFAALDFYNELSTVQVDGTRLRLAGTVLNQLDRIPRDGQVGLELLVGPRRRRDRPQPIAVDALRHLGETLEWTATVDLASTVHADGYLDRSWEIRPRLRLGTQSNTGRLSTRDRGHDGLVIPVRPRFGRLVADRLETLVTADGDLTLQFVAVNRAARGIDRAGRRLARSRQARVARDVVRRTRKALRNPRHPRLVDAVFRRVIVALPMRRRSIVFESEGGTRYTGSPRAIYEEIRRRGLPVDAVWAHTGDTARFPAEARLVRRGSVGYYLALARAGIWIDDRGFPPAAVKRSGTVYLQTWSGTPLGWVGFDAGAMRRATNAARVTLRKSVDRWDALLTRAPYDAEVLARAFRLSAETLPFGHPRNDALVTGGDPAQLEALRAELGIRPDQRVVLHIPACAQAAFVPDGTVLAGHRQVLVVRPSGAVWRRRVTPAPRLISAEGVDDLTSLLLIADVLVTDHHPSMFDMPLLRRPVLLVSCRCGIRPRRGSNAEAYLDIDTVAPTPAAHTAEELAAQLAELDSLTERQVATLDWLAATYGSYDTGKAAAQAVDWLFRAGA